MKTRYEGAIIDLDGTVYRGGSALEGAVAAVERLRAAGVSTVFLTNNPIKRRAVYVERLRSFGIDVVREDVINSAAIAGDFLAETHLGEPTFVVGEDPLVAELEAAGVPVTADPAEATVVLASMDRAFSYDDLRDALVAFENDPAFYATNPDRTCPVEGGEIPDAAAMIGAIEGLTGRELDRVLGKPSSIAVAIAADRLGVDPERCLVVGDRLETDVVMGQQAGMTSVLVLSGVTDREDLEQSSIEPAYVLESLGEIETVFE
ncbi:HAD-IIA family hydrolase [Saliphagus sp. GCM10025317]